MPTERLMAWRWRWLLILGTFFLLMLTIGAVPGEADALSSRYGDKLLHALAYGFMALLCHQAIQAEPWLRGLLTVGLIALLGLADESLQSLLPYRNASAIDWCFDIAAAMIVAVLLALTARFVQPAETHAQENQ